MNRKDLSDLLVVAGLLLLGKVIFDALKTHRCPRCNYPVDKTDLYCPNCAQPLDWRGK